MDSVDGRMKVRILIVDAQPQIRRGLTMRLSLETNLQVIGDVGGELALSMIEKRRPDLVLLDLELPDIDSMLLAAQIRRQQPHCLVVMLSLHEDGVTVERALAAGAAAVVSKRQMDTVLIATIQAVVQRSSF